MQAIVLNYEINFSIVNGSHRRKRWQLHHLCNSSHSFQLWQDPFSSFRLHRRQKTSEPCKFRPKPAIGGANTKSLLKLDIARSSVNIQQHAAIPHLALDMVLGQRALSCDLVVIEPQRP